MRSNDLKPQFVLIMGGAGSGKNHFISTNPVYSKYNLIDVDAIKGELGVATAIKQIKPLLTQAFEQRQNIAHPTTGSNLKAQQNKINLAHEYGYNVTLILINTPIDRAIDQVRNRVRKGGHDVQIDRIVSSNKNARENYDSLSAIADVAKVV